MNNDRELLELAAKALGRTLSWADAERNPIYSPRLSAHGLWNPLNDDGDALRLAVKLKIDLEWQNDDDTVEAYIRSGKGSTYCPSYPASEYKRAIVDVAANVGRSMP